MKIKREFSIILSIFLCISLCSCKKKNSQDQDKEEKELKVYVDIKDKNSLSIIKFLTEEYMKKNTKVKLKINDVLETESNIVEEISKGDKADLILTSRNTMIELSKKGLLSDMSQYYDKNKINEKYYNIMSSYGRFEDKYYGISIIPYVITAFYNKDAINKLGISKMANVEDILGILKKFKENNIRIPVIVPEDLDINIVLSSMIASNRVKISDLDGAYDNKNSYKNIKEMQYIFDDINTAVREGIINKNSFEIGNESTFTSLINGSIPFIISTSYYYDKLKDSNIETINDIIITNNIKANIPVLVDTILSLPINGKNSEEASEFIKFVLDEKTQEELVKKGYITGNKKANAEIQGLGENIVTKLSNANQNSIVYIYNLPKNFNKIISYKINNILLGNYSKNEWNEILNEIYK
ncbi:carbohydrate ABC transporter substrate-binding protein, CUT1 family [Clostridium sp. USBA 49]|uniref:ABC transporter substrate-binding protein n=1 Tax=Clostridium sp. USBA 49 TaxID=1881060 RepID=UPI00099A11BD|nr:ABC transporter substrate-binding protein [Clostridium sp. USBA 49]SKA80810.1 carbohydrate ABC transporter substrate-binding protein, CUT1 family [Clostridium sp. USBA 49]